jgi:tripartite-type tricarboxylate transporter receptor subunit TctC
MKGREGELLKNVVAVSVLCVLATLSSVVFAQSTDDKKIADFYRGNTVYMIIGSGPGGSFDFYGRTVAKYMAKYIPGKPTVVPQNLPGAGGYTAGNRVSVAAPQDGTYIGAIQPAVIMDPVLGDSAQGIKRLNLAYLGNAAPNIEGCFIRSDAPAKSFEEAMSKEIIMGATNTTGGSAYGYLMLLRHILGVKMKIVAGYVSTTEIMLAMDRNEVQAICGIGYQSVLSTKVDWFRRGIVHAFTYQGSKILPEAEMADARPAVFYAKTDEQRQIFTLYDRQGEFGRPFVTGATVPPERIHALRDAFMKAMNDGELRAELKTRGLDVDPMSGEEVQKLVDAVYATPSEIVEKTRSVMHTE